MAAATEHSGRRAVENNRPPQAAERHSAMCRVWLRVADTNSRGFAGNFARQAGESMAGLRKLAPWKWQQQPADPAEQTKLARLLEIPFAIIGSFGFAAGLVSLPARDGSAVPGRASWPALSATCSCVRGGSSRLVLALTPRVVPRGRPARGWRVTIALLASVGGVIFGIGMAMDQMTIAVAAWGIGGLPPHGPGAGRQIWQGPGNVRG